MQINPICPQWLKKNKVLQDIVDFTSCNTPTIYHQPTKFIWAKNKMGLNTICLNICRSGSSPSTISTKSNERSMQVQGGFKTTFRDIWPPITFNTKHNKLKLTVTLEHCACCCHAHHSHSVARRLWNEHSISLSTYNPTYKNPTAWNRVLWRQMNWTKIG